MVLGVDETVDLIQCRKGVGFLVAVLGDSADESVGDADVESSGAAGQDVDVVVMFSRHGLVLGRSRGKSW